MSSTTESELSRHSVCPSVARFNAIGPIRYSSFFSNSVSNQHKVEVSATPRSQILCELINRNIRSAASRSASFYIFIARQATVDRLPQQIGQRELLVQTLSRVAQVFHDELLQAQLLVQLAHQNW